MNHWDTLQCYQVVGYANSETLTTLVHQAQEEVLFDPTRLLHYWKAISDLRTRLEALPALPLFASLRAYERAYLDNVETLIMAMQRGEQARVAAVSITLQETQQCLVVERERLLQALALGAA